MGNKIDSPRVVARRTLRTEGGKEVEVTISEPVRARPDEWECEFRISGLAREIVARAPGVDSVQALLLAFEGVRAHLAREGERLTWAGGEPGDFGIPRSIPSAFGLEVEKRLAQLVDDEVIRLVEARRASRGKPPSHES
jgi:hypothetical protein